MNAFHLDPLGGVAGDMFAAALLDLRPELETGLRELLKRCRLLDDITVDVCAHEDGILTGRRFTVSNGQESRNSASHHASHGNNHHHGPHQHDHPPHEHVEWRGIRHLLEGMQAAPEVIRHAIGIFSQLAHAEARVHGTTTDTVTFHEVGAWDSIADVLSAAYLIDAVGTAQWTIGPIPLGSGRVRTAHGLLPIPAPATALLLEGFTMVDDGVSGERVTPTGAAIVRYLCKRPDATTRSGRMAGAGYGFGARHLPGISNCLRILAFDEAAELQTNVIAVLECEIDDQTGEDMAIALAHIRDHAGVLDALQAPTYGKKGRMMTHLRVLVAPYAAQEVAQLIFDETTTIGVRHILTHRFAVPRKLGTVEINGQILRAKTATRPGGPTTKLEADELQGVRGQGARESLRRNFVPRP
jgi:hypothetical protein